MEKLVVAEVVISQINDWMRKAKNWDNLAEKMHEIDQWQDDHTKEQAWIAKGKIAEGHIGIGYTSDAVELTSDRVTK